MVSRLALVVHGATRRVERLSDKVRLRMTSLGQVHSGPFTNQGNFLNYAVFEGIEGLQSMEGDFNISALYPSLLSQNHLPSTR